MNVSFTVFGTCEPQGSMKAFIPKGGTRPVVTSDNKDLVPWRQQVTRTARTVIRDKDMAEPHVAVTLKLDFFVARPKSKPKKFKQPTSRPDLDKYSRAIFDALTGVAYKDDSQVCKTVAEKHFGLPERVEITVTTNEEPGPIWQSGNVLAV